MQAFLEQLMKAATDAGIEAAEAYVVEKDSFSVITNCGELIDYQSNMTRGLGFRGLVKGRMGYASTEAFDAESIAQLIKGSITANPYQYPCLENPMDRGAWRATVHGVAKIRTLLSD